MSRCFDINCHKCKESLWIGQRDHIYGTKDIWDDLNGFLFKHEGHPLTFEYEEKNEYSQFERKLNGMNR